jgi:hypothetical protein
VRRLKVIVFMMTAVLVARGATAEETAQAPELKPGIPGLKMVDVRDHKHLWREIEELQTWERGDRISVAEYRGKVIEKTVQFLGFEEASAKGFTTAAAEAVAGLRESFRAGRRADVDPAEAQALLDSGLTTAVTRVTSLLRKEPRHELFAPDCKKWLLRLAFGPSEAKEAKEAKAGL